MGLVSTAAVVALLGAVAVVCVGAAVTQTRGARLTGEIITNADQTVSVQVDVYGGSPPSNRQTWSLPDGTVISATAPSGVADFTTSASGKSNPQDGATFTYTLLLHKGYTFSEQRITFRAEYTGSPGWYQSYSFTLGARTRTPAVSAPATVNKPAVEVKLATITGEQIDDPTTGKYTLSTVTLGGSPAADTFQWELEDGRIIKPGHDDADYKASSGVRGSDGSHHYDLELKRGLTSSPQSVKFKASATNSWWRSFTFNLPSKVQATVQEAGRVTGDVDRSVSGSTTINALIIGGHPAANTFSWTLTRADGSTQDITPGTGSASAVGQNSNGQTTLSFTVSGTWKTVKLYVTSEANGFESWWASRTWRSA